MFKSRSGSQGHAPTPAAPSIDALRRRARHRLMGAAVLVLAGVVGFPLLFDTAPRPLTADVPIDIPARGTSRLPTKTTPPAAGSAAPSPVDSSRVPAAQALDATEAMDVPETRASSAPAVAAATASAPAVQSNPEPSKLPVSKPELPQPEAARQAPAAKAEPVRQPASPVQERFIVQVGAFADAQRAQEVRLRLERAGLKTYTHVAETSEGKRIRVRLGPFPSRAEAETAATRAKALGLQAAILTL